MRKFCLVAIAIAASITAQAATAEYVSKSQFSKNYKCVVSESGGFKHTQTGHQLVRFSDNEEYFLTHISRLPIESVSKMRDPSIVARFNGNESLIRKDAEDAFAEISDDEATGLHIEEYTYFLRESSRDPKKEPNLLTTCKAFGKGGKLLEISCKFEPEKFEFSPETGRFMVTYAGNWVTLKQGTPETSSFSFGNCKEYYD